MIDPGSGIYLTSPDFYLIPAEAEPVKHFGRLMDWLGVLSGWLFVATGLFLTYEVVARYVFSAPTIWAAEVSQMFLIWGMFLALPRTIGRRENIAIDVLYELLPNPAKQFCDNAALIFIACFCAVVFWYGWEIAWDSFARGRSTGTMLNIPNWWTEIVIPIGFFLSMLVCISGLIKPTDHARDRAQTPGGGH